MPRMANLRARSMSAHDLASAGLLRCLLTVWPPEPALQDDIKNIH